MNWHNFLQRKQSENNRQKFWLPFHLVEMTPITKGVSGSALVDPLKGMLIKIRLFYMNPPSLLYLLSKRKLEAGMWSKSPTLSITLPPFLGSGITSRIPQKDCALTFWVCTHHFLCLELWIPSPPLLALIHPGSSPGLKSQFKLGLQREVLTDQAWDLGESSPCAFSATSLPVSFYSTVLSTKWGTPVLYSFTLLPPAFPTCLVQRDVCLKSIERKKPNYRICSIEVCYFGFFYLGVSKVKDTYAVCQADLWFLVCPFMVEIPFVL